MAASIWSLPPTSITIGRNRHRPWAGKNQADETTDRDGTRREREPTHDSTDVLGEPKVDGKADGRDEAGDQPHHVEALQITDLNQQGYTNHSAGDRSPGDRPWMCMTGYPIPRHHKDRSEELEADGGPDPDPIDRNVEGPVEHDLQDPDQADQDRRPPDRSPVNDRPRQEHEAGDRYAE